MSISSKDYIKWVQRGMNRIVDAELVCNGVITPQYREAVKTFQLATGLTPTSDIGPKDQNKIIKISDRFYEYIEWVQDALSSPKVGIDIPTHGAMDQTTKNAIKSFQAFNGLDDDGWVGPVTETKLVVVSGILPFGHLQGGGPTPKPKPTPTKPKPLPPSDIPVSNRVTQIINHTYHHAMFNRDAYKPGERQTLICVLGKLRKRDGINDSFISESRLFNAYQGNAKYKTLNSVKLDAREYLTQRVTTMRPDQRRNPISGRIICKDLIKLIEGGLDYAYHVRRGTYAKSKNADFAPLMKDVDDFLDTQKGKSNSIISCFKGTKWL